MSTIVQYVFVYFYTIWSDTKEIFTHAKLPYIFAKNAPFHAEISYIKVPPARPPLSEKFLQQNQTFSDTAWLLCFIIINSTNKNDQIQAV